MQEDGGELGWRRRLTGKYPEGGEWKENGGVLGGEEGVVG